MQDTNPSGVSVSDVADLIESIDDETYNDPLPEDEGEELPIADEQQPEPEPEDEDEQVEFEGKEYKVPKELKEALLRQSDYTRKTQEVAEQRREIEQKAQLLEQREAAMSAQFEKAVEMRMIHDKLAQFKAIDWQSLADTDPVQATKLNLAYQQLQQQANEKYAELQQARVQAEQLTQTQRQQMLAEAQKDLMQRLPNFGAETAEKIKTAARQYGISDAELNNVIDPRYVHILHDAMQWRALQAQKPKAMQKVAEAQRVVKPAAQTPNPQKTQKLERLNARFRSGKAGLNDLAAYLDS